MSNFEIGHILTKDSAKISSIPIAANGSGKVIYDESSGTQFVDFGGVRHTYGSVLTGVFIPSSGYVSFAGKDPKVILNNIALNGNVKSGQLVYVDTDSNDARYSDYSHRILQYHCDTKDSSSKVHAFIDPSNKFRAAAYIHSSALTKSGSIDVLLAGIKEGAVNGEYPQDIIFGSINSANASSATFTGINNNFTLYVKLLTNGIVQITTGGYDKIKVLSASSTSGANSNCNIYAYVL